jgi:competence protein ComEC
MGIAHHGFFGEGSRVPLGASRAATRKQVASRLAAAGLSAGLVRALAMGDRSGLSRETRQAFRRLGLAHLIAISGLHIGFIAGLAGWLGLLAVLRLCPPARTIRVFEVSLVFASCAAAFYAWWTDAGVSVERAALLFGLYAVLRLVWRRIPASSALAWVALGLLMHDPAALFDVGAQLSFTACAALMAGGVWRNDSPSLTPMGETRWRVTVQGIRSLCRTSLVVSIATAPLLIQHGFALSPLSPFVNILAIPFTGFVALPCSLLVAGLSGIDAVPDSWLRALSLPASAMEEAAIGLAVGIPQWPAGEGLGWPLLVLLLGLAFAALRQGRWGPTMVIWLVVSGAGASPVLFESPMASLPRVIFFDVGQGDAALIQGREAVILVDTGPGPATGEGGATLLRGLRAAKVRRIDLLVLTHGDLDHRAGLIRVLESIEVVELWLPGTGSSDPVLRKAAGEARARGTRVSWQVAADRRDAQPVRRGDLELEVLWPLATGSMFKTSRNAESLVLRVGVDERSFLFTADIGEPVEDALLQRGSRVDADVLKVGHHGSGGSSSRAFLARVSPELAILSAPCTASRGLPNGQAIERIRRSGAKIWWTGRDGAVIVAPLSRGRFSVQGSGRVRDCSPR